MRLNKLQENFKNQIMEESDGGLLNLISGKTSLKKERMKIYRGNILSSISGSMKITYSSILKLVGDEFFEFMTFKYIKDHLPNHANLNLYGGNFADFIDDFTMTKKLHYLSDVARFEWAWNLCYNAEDDKAITSPNIVDYDTMSPENTYLRRNPQLIAIKYPADEIWQTTERFDGKGIEKINLNNKYERYILFFRINNKINYSEISKIEYNILREMQKGKSLAKVADQNRDDDIISLIMAKFLIKQIFTGEK